MLYISGAVLAPVVLSVFQISMMLAIRGLMGNTSVHQWKGIYIKFLQFTVTLIVVTLSTVLGPTGVPITESPPTS